MVLAKQFLQYDGDFLQVFCGNSISGKPLWRIACLSLLWIVWREIGAVEGLFQTETKKHSNKHEDHNRI